MLEKRSPVILKINQKSITASCEWVFFLPLQSFYQGEASLTNRQHRNIFFSHNKLAMLGMKWPAAVHAGIEFSSVQNLEPKEGVLTTMRPHEALLFKVQVKLIHSKTKQNKKMQIKFTKFIILFQSHITFTSPEDLHCTAVCNVRPRWTLWANMTLCWSGHCPLHKAGSHSKQVVWW